MNKSTPTLRRLCATSILILATLNLCHAADTVFVTSNTSNCASASVCGQSPNFDVNPNTGMYVYTDNGFGSFTSAIATSDGKPPTPGARFFSNSFSNSTPDLGITLNPALGTPGGVYQIYHVFSSAAGNVSSNIVVGVTNVSGGTLSFTNTDKFQSIYGTRVSGVHPWQFLGYLTNDPGGANPIITFYFESGNVSAGAQQRLVVDTFRFIEYEPCLDVPGVQVTGPLATNIPTVVVTGVSNAAERVTVYQDSGSGMVAVGSTNLLSPTGNVHVAVSGLARGAQVAATQTLGGQESCVPTTGSLVGGGANPSIRVAFSIRANPTLEGPVGAASSGTNSHIHFLGSSTVLSGAAPEQGAVLQPSTNWQTVTFTRGDINAPIDPSVIWNGTNPLEGMFGGLDGIAIASEGDTGPYVIYLDDLANGTHGIVQDWESADAGAANYQFNSPGFSGTTSGNLLAAPNQSVVTTATSVSGSKSLRVNFQFNSMDNNKWVRLVTANNTGAAQNPQFDLNEPISIQVLLLPPGVTIEVPAPGPLSISREGAQLTLDWSGNFQLQRALDASGPFEDLQGVMSGPYTTETTNSATFYRLRN